MKPCSIMKRRTDASALLRATKRARRLVGDQVDVALAVLLLGVGETVELVGQRAQALGEEAQPLHVDRQLAGLGLEQRPLGADDVAEVEVLERRVVLGADRVDADAQLDAAGGVLQRREAGLAHDALEHQAAGGGHRDRLRLEGVVVEVAVLASELGGAVPGLEVVREGDAAGAEGGELFAALGDEGVVFERERFGGHGGPERPRILRTASARPATIRPSAAGIATLAS
jgi:hypothetical protein